MAAWLIDQGSPRPPPHSPEGLQHTLTKGRYQVHHHPGTHSLFRTSFSYGSIIVQYLARLSLHEDLGLSVCPTGVRLGNAVHRKENGCAGKGPGALVLAPTRELATQISAVLEDAGSECGLSCLCAYGGVPKAPQVQHPQNSCNMEGSPPPPPPRASGRRTRKVK